MVRLLSERIYVLDLKIATLKSKRDELIRQWKFIEFYKTHLGEYPGEEWTEYLGGKP